MDGKRIENLIQDSCSFFQIKKADLISSSCNGCKGQVVDIRFMISHLSRTAISLCERESYYAQSYIQRHNKSLIGKKKHLNRDYIAKNIGFKTPQAVSYACKMCQTLIDFNPAFRKKYNLLTEHLLSIGYKLA